MLDSLIISIPLVIIAGVLTGNFDADEPIAKLLSALYSILVPVYWYGRTIGKRICGIRIRQYDTHEPPIRYTRTAKNWYDADASCRGWTCVYNNFGYRSYCECFYGWFA